MSQLLFNIKIGNIFWKCQKLLNAQVSQFSINLAVELYKTDLEVRIDTKKRFYFSSRATNRGRGNSSL